MTTTTIKRKPYSKYNRAFGMNLNEIQIMDRLEFAKKFGNKFKFMSQSKFLKTLDQIATAFEQGQEKLREYK